MFELKLLHAADLHLGSGFRGLPRTKRDTRCGVHHEIPRHLARLCREEGCQMVLLAGDVFHEPEPEPALIRGLLQALEETEVPVLIAPGNHDPLPLWHRLERQGLPGNVHVFSGSVGDVAFPELHTRVWGAGFETMDCPGFPNGFHATGSELWQIGLFHGDPVNAGSPHRPITRSQVETSGFSYLALGHIHKAGRFTAGHTLCAWPGCPMGTGFDETGSKGVFVVTLTPGKAPTLNFRDLGLGRYESLEVGVAPDRDTLGTILGILPPDTRQDVYRITLTGTGEQPDMDGLRDALASRFYELILEDHTMAPVDLWEGVGSDSLEGLYMALLKEFRDAATPEDREIAELAAQISRRLLEGQEVELP